MRTSGDDEGLIFVALSNLSLLSFNQNFCRRELLLFTKRR